jgi:hypothetical protein
MTLKASLARGYRPEEMEPAARPGPVVLVFVCLSLFLWAAPAGAEDKDERRTGSVPTNLDLVESLVRETVDGALESAPFSPDDTVHVRGSGVRHRLDWVVENYLLARLAAEVEAVYIDPTGREAGKRGGAEEGADREDGMSKGDRFEAQRKKLEEEGAEGDEGGGSLTDLIKGKSAVGDSVGAGPGDVDVESDEDAEAGKASIIDPGTIQADGRPAEGDAEASEDEGGEEEAEFREMRFETPQVGKVLEYKIGEIEIRYPRHWRGSLFGSAMVERSVRAVIFFRLIDKTDGRVIWADSGRASVTDVVSRKLLEDLEVPREGGNETESGAGGLGRVVEPIVVSGIVVGLVFLFYSSRT